VCGEKELVESGAQLKEVRSAGLQVPQSGGEVIDAVAVARAAIAVPALVGLFVDVQAGGAVFVKWSVDLA